ncbi:hypothetical protein [Mangrovicoccus sp. HB161399]|uniref:hypothetical protein n=1 Tax=Mangrovicoccus sp. HB161399 TaxID=2720392 RepID=UPI0015563C2E|nr:hypothetical protein [Mangrovicoccus sp. HB161399]
MLTQAQLNTAMARMVQTPQPMVLFHGTNTPVFFSKVCIRTGFESNEMFMAKYSLASLGGSGRNAANYGPGIYLVDSRIAAVGYGALVIRAEFESTTNYMDLHTVATRRGHLMAIGVPLQDLLAEPQLYGLIRVTQNYYVMRTPFNCTIGAG